MGAVFENLTEEELCDLMCGAPEDDDMQNKVVRRKRGTGG